MHSNEFLSRATQAGKALQGMFVSCAMPCALNVYLISLSTLMGFSD